MAVSCVPIGIVPMQHGSRGLRILEPSSRSPGGFGAILRPLKQSSTGEFVPAA
jgi:hypothetical protein